jgi:site-specific recombinase XerD
MTKLLPPDPPDKRSVVERRGRAIASYLSRLAEGPSRKTMQACLVAVASILQPPKANQAKGDLTLLDNLYAFPWERLTSTELDALKLTLQHGHRRRRLLDGAGRTVGRRSDARKSLGPSSVNKHLAAVKGVLRGCFRERLLDADAYAHIQDVRSVKGSKVLRGREIPLAERKKLILVCDLTTIRGARDAAIVSLLYSCGVRRAELATVRLGNYDGSKGLLTVLGKGNKERQLDVVGGSKAALEHYLSLRGRQPGPLLLSFTWGRYSLPRKDGRGVTGAAILHIVKDLGRRAGIAALSPHDFRRTCIGDLLEAGVDPATVQKVAGHEKNETTMQYDRRPAQKRREAVAKLVVPFPGMPELLLVQDRRLPPNVDGK